GARLDPGGVQGNGKEPAGNLLARGDHDIVFALVWHAALFGAFGLGSVRRNCRLTRPGHQLVGFACHGGNHHRDLVAALDLALHQTGDMADALDVGHRGAAELHRYRRHASSTLGGFALNFAAAYINGVRFPLNPRNRMPDSASIDPAEIAKFAGWAAEWWDP